MQRTIPRRTVDVSENVLDFTIREPPLAPMKLLCTLNAICVHPTLARRIPLQYRPMTLVPIY